jgi:transcriptional regulator
MYIPEAFSMGLAEALDRIEAHGFAVLVSTVDGRLLATHLPLLLDRGRGERGTLLGHLARGSAHARALASGVESLAVFRGPHGYVSPAWYADQPSVPTWNYFAVHARGTPRTVDDPAAVRAMLARLVATYETAGSGWSMASLPEGYLDGMMRGIVAFEMPIAYIDAKAKMSQNRSSEDRRRIAAALRERGAPDDEAMAAFIASG